MVNVYIDMYITVEYFHSCIKLSETQFDDLFFVGNLNNMGLVI